MTIPAVDASQLPVPSGLILKDIYTAYLTTYWKYFGMDDADAETERTVAHHALKALGDARSSTHRQLLADARPSVNGLLGMTFAALNVCAEGGRDVDALGRYFEISVKAYAGGSFFDRFSIELRTYREIRAELIAFVASLELSTEGKQKAYEQIRVMLFSGSLSGLCAILCNPPSRPVVIATMKQLVTQNAEPSAKS